MDYFLAPGGASCHVDSFGVQQRDWSDFNPILAKIIDGEISDHLFEWELLHLGVENGFLKGQNALVSENQPGKSVDLGSEMTTKIGEWLFAAMWFVDFDHVTSKTLRRDCVFHRGPRNVKMQYI